jgi:hypothetical protein
MPQCVQRFHRGSSTSTKNLQAEVISSAADLEQILVAGVKFARDRMTTPSSGHNRIGATAAAVRR